MLSLPQNLFSYILMILSDIFKVILICWSSTAGIASLTEGFKRWLKISRVIVEIFLENMYSEYFQVVLPITDVTFYPQPPDSAPLRKGCKSRIGRHSAIVEIFPGNIYSGGSRLLRNGIKSFVGVLPRKCLFMLYSRTLLTLPIIPFTNNPWKCISL